MHTPPLSCGLRLWLLRMIGNGIYENYVIVWCITIKNDMKIIKINDTSLNYIQYYALDLDRINRKKINEKEKCRA